MPEIQWNRAQNMALALKKQFQSKKLDVRKYIDAK